MAITKYARIKPSMKAKIKRTRSDIKMYLGNNRVGVEYSEVTFENKKEADKYIKSIECETYMDVESKKPAAPMPPKPVNKVEEKKEDEPPKNDEPKASEEKKEEKGDK